MKMTDWLRVEEAQTAATAVLRHNLKGPYQGLPRTAGWGYPEPYTRDLLLSALGTLVSGDEQLLAGLRQTLVKLGQNQSRRGHIPSLVHDPESRGASDTTPLFLWVLGLYRRFVGEPDFLEEAAQKALVWMAYQSPDDRGLVGQLPTSDWRDEQWVLGYGLYVNVVYYAALRTLGRREMAESVRALMNRFIIRGEAQPPHVHEGLAVPHSPHYALWAYKVHKNTHFDLLGNSLAVLTGIASPSRSKKMIRWIEASCRDLRHSGDLAGDLPPCLIPFIHPKDEEWRPRYEFFNQPGEYHNGGIWPFISGLYVAALVKTGAMRLAEEKLLSLTRMTKLAADTTLEFGFNEWHKAQDGLPRGQDWQSWSAALYLYVSHCVQTRRALFFE
jgi:hypothetical protein